MLGVAPTSQPVPLLHPPRCSWCSRDLVTLRLLPEAAPASLQAAGSPRSALAQVCLVTASHRGAALSCP